MDLRAVAVTGGARGIGLCIARTLAGAGMRVIIGDLDGDLAGQRAKEWGGVGLSLDVRDEESYAAFLDQVGPVDVLVNNAGVAVAGTFVGTSAAEHAVQVEVNLSGVARGMRLVLPSMLERGRGDVVNIASAAGLIPAPGAAVYTASKHAVVGLSDAVRTELRGTGVRVTAVLPTVVRTEMAAGLVLHYLPQVSPEAVARAVARVLRQRRPPAAVIVPRWLRPLAIGDAVSPQWLRDLARRIAAVDPVGDRIARAPYAARVARQIDG
jgi:hypothetical protein